MIQMILLQPLDVPPTHRPLQSGLVLQHLLDRLYLFLLRRFSSSFCPPAPGAVHKHGGRGHHHGRLGRDGNGAPVGARVLATGQAVAGQARDGDGMRDTQHLRSDARPPPHRANFIPRGRVSCLSQRGSRTSRPDCHPGQLPGDSAAQLGKTAWREGHLPDWGWRVMYLLAKNGATRTAPEPVHPPKWERPRMALAACYHVYSIKTSGTILLIKQLGGGGAHAQV